MHASTFFSNNIHHFVNVRPPRPLSNFPSNQLTKGFRGQANPFLESRSWDRFLGSQYFATILSVGLVNERQVVKGSKVEAIFARGRGPPSCRPWIEGLRPLGRAVCNHTVELDKPLMSGRIWNKKKRKILGKKKYRMFFELCTLHLKQQIEQRQKNGG